MLARSVLQSGYDVCGVDDREIIAQVEPLSITAQHPQSEGMERSHPEFMRNRLPVLAKAGAILPQYVPTATTDAQPKDHLIIAAYAGASGQFRLYEDDGISEDYRTGQAEWTPITSRIEGSTWTVIIEATLYYSLVPSSVGEFLKLPAYAYEAKVVNSALLELTVR